jgi:murein DD-endopeptidase
VDEGGRTTSGDPDIPAKAAGYGEQVVAVADGVVAAVRDGIPESRSISANPKQPRDRASGNYVALEIGSRKFAIYEHLKPRTIIVSRGQRVRKGDVIGAVGFTGDSTGPHLHFHVADCASPLRCEGVPFAIRGMTEIGRYENIASLGKARWNSRRPRGALGAEWPGSNVVVRFRCARPASEACEAAAATFREASPSLSRERRAVRGEIGPPPQCSRSETIPTPLELR